VYFLIRNIGVVVNSKIERRSFSGGRYLIEGNLEVLERIGGTRKMRR